MKKNNGKWVVLVILGFVFVASLIAYVVQQRIDANRGKPVPEAPVSAEQG